jgi:hypothetical protein
MDDKLKIRYVVSAVLVFCAVFLAGLTATAAAQEPTVAAKPDAAEKSSGRDPFKKFEPARKVKPALAKLEPPSIQVRVDRYRAQKMAAASAHVAPPKPTTVLLLDEMQVTGIFRTPRGWSAMVEATPFNPKLSYVVYPGETFFDGQLVAIEEGRLVFRRDIVWNDGRREKSVEVKPLRAPSPVEAMAAKAAPASASTAEGEKVANPIKH